MLAAVNGTEINYEISGKEGAPWVTFSNSLATNHTMWDDQAAALADDFHILRYDKRGHGGSAAPEGPYTFDDLIGDILGLWDHLGIEKSHFIGLSIGGMSAFGLAQDHGDRLISAVMSNCRADAPAEFKNAWDDRIAFVEENGLQALADPTVERWSSKSFYASGSDRLEKLRNMVLSTSQTGFIGCARALQTLNFGPRLGEITTPSLLIGGDEDGGTPAENMRKMQAELPGAEYVELSPAGHISNMEQPEKYNEILKDWLGRH